MERVTNFLMGRYTANIYNQITIMSERLQPGYYNLVIVVLLTIVLVVKLKSNLVDYTANIFKVIFTVFNCVQLSTVVSLYGLHLIAAPSTIK